MATGSPEAPSSRENGMRAETSRMGTPDVCATILQDLPDIVLEDILANIDGRSLRSVLLTGNPRLQYFARCRYNQVCWQVLNSWSKWYRPAVESKSTEMLQRIQMHAGSEYGRVVRQMGLRLDHSFDNCDANLYLHFAPIAHTFARHVDNVHLWLGYLEAICSKPGSETYRLDEYMNIILGLLGFIADVAFPQPLTTVPVDPAALLALEQRDVVANDGHCFDLSQVTNAIAQPRQVAVIDEWMASQKQPDIYICRWVRDMFVRTCLLQSAVAQCESVCVRHIGDNRLFSKMLPKFKCLRRLWVYQLGETDLPWVVEYLQRPECRVVDVTLNACMPDYVRHSQLMREWVRFPPNREKVVRDLRGARQIERRMERVRFCNHHYLTDQMIAELRTRFAFWPDFEFENSRWMDARGFWIERAERERTVPSVPELCRRKHGEPMLWSCAMAVRKFLLGAVMRRK